MMNSQGKSFLERWLNLEKSSRWILVWIIIFTIGAWVYMAVSGNSMAGMNMDMNASDDSAMQAEMAARAANSIAGISLPSLGMFIPMWFAMCVAMMLPTAVSMILCMDKLARRRHNSQSLVPLMVIMFVMGYLIVWLGFGLVCWLAGYFLFDWLYPVLSQSQYLWLALGLIFLFAGIYQNSPLKYACLRGCQHPLSFLMNHWHSGNIGALRMGLLHGVHCSGCCAALMIIMFPLGMMNLVWMGIFTIIMYIEKNALFGTAVSKVIGWLLLVVGVIVTLLSIVLCLL